MPSAGPRATTSISPGRPPSPVAWAVEHPPPSTLPPPLARPTPTPAAAAASTTPTPSFVRPHAAAQVQEQAHAQNSASQISDSPPTNITSMISSAVPPLVAGLADGPCETGGERRGRGRGKGEGRTCTSSPPAALARASCARAADAGAARTRGMGGGAGGGVA
jgi:hypothetical protein